MEKVLISKCHRAEVREEYGQEDDNGVEHPLGLYVCEKCQDSCEVEEVCGECLGTKKVATDEDDGEGHTMRGVGEQKCPSCSITNEEDNF